MRPKQIAVRWRSKSFLARLLASYLLVPLIPPVLLLLSARGFGHMGVGDWLGIVLLYGIFGFGAMLLLGTPLLVLYLWLGWTGFVPFMAGGGICAGITSYAFLHRSHDLGMVAFFTIAGIGSGLIFRIVLFGFRRGA